MNWIKLDGSLKEFSSFLKEPLTETNTSTGSGTISTYRISEANQIFYEIKYVKPIKEWGSHIRIWSRFLGELKVTGKRRWFQVPKVSGVGRNTELQGQLIKLVSEIGSYSWKTQRNKYGWPQQLNGVDVLFFECGLSVEATEDLKLIRSIHLELMGLTE
ncbi:MAG: hypothetical protein RIC80_14845 [Cyclobacteriaceae bacterium]